MDRRRLLVACELVQGGIMGILALGVPPFAVLLALVVLRSALASVVRPAVLGAIPGLVSDERLDRANALFRAGDEGAGIVGPALAGLLAFVGIRGLFLIDAATFVAAGVLLVGLPRGRAAEEPEDGLLASGGRGLRYVLGEPVTRAIALGLSLFVLFAAMENVARPFLARNDLGGGEGGVGFLAAAPQVGLLLGFLAVARLGLKRRGWAALLGGFALCSLGTLATGLAPTLGLAMAAQVISGIGNGIEVASIDTVLSRTVPRELLGRVFANVYGAAQIATGIAYAAGGPLLDATSPRTLFLIVGTGGLAATALTAALLPRGPADL
jgi:MFS family permease